jgi:hypothetical protein
MYSVNTNVSEITTEEYINTDINVNVTLTNTPDIPPPLVPDDPFIFLHLKSVLVLDENGNELKVSNSSKLDVTITRNSTDSVISISTILADVFTRGIHYVKGTEKGKVDKFSALPEGYDAIFSYEAPTLIKLEYKLKIEWYYDKSIPSNTDTPSNLAIHGTTILPFYVTRDQDKENKTFKAALEKGKFIPVSSVAKAEEPKSTLSNTDNLNILAFTSNVQEINEIGVGTWKLPNEIKFSAKYENFKSYTIGTISKQDWDDLEMQGFTGPQFNKQPLYYPDGLGKIVIKLTAKHDFITATKELTFSFVNKIYYGASSIQSGWTSEQIKILTNKELSDVKERRFESFALENQYIIYAYPKRLGDAIISVSGVSGGFELPETISLTNDSGYIEDYYVYRSTNSGLGKLQIEIK